MNTKEIAVNYGKASAQTFFKDMLNVQFQGENFNWNNFPQMFRGICSAGLFMQYPKTPKNLKELEEVAVKSMIEEGISLKTEYEKQNTLPLRDFS